LNYEFNEGAKRNVRVCEKPIFVIPGLNRNLTFRDTKSAVWCPNASKMVVFDYLGSMPVSRIRLKYW